MAPRSLHLPILIDIPAPCSEVWGDMVGDDRVRYCERCDKQIHNLSLLTEAQIAELVVRESVCVSLEARTDGTLVSADLPARDKGRGPGRASRVVVTAALSALAACGSDHVVGKALPSHPPGTTVAEPSARTLDQPALSASAVVAAPVVPVASCDAPVPSATSSAQPPVRHFMGAPKRADPPPAITHKVGKMTRVPTNE